MSNRGLPKRRRYITLCAAGLIVVGGAAVAVGATSGDSGTQQVVATSTVSSSTESLASASASATTTATAGTTDSASAGPTAGVSPTAGTAGATVPAFTPSVTPSRRKVSHMPAPSVFTGRAFDACTAPSLTTMNAWRSNSPYGAAAVYVGGQNRGCAQPQLTASWVRSVHVSGWRLIPIYVGAQPPCQTSGNPERITAGNASSLGATDGVDAAAKASALGMRSGSAVYLDMEAYDISDASCVKSVLEYVQAWDRATHAKGYWAGFYGFSSSSAAAIASVAPGAADLPDALWYARYDGNADTTTGFPFSADLWTGHRRGHQYAVNKNETYGGSTVTVDHDAWDAPVAIIG